MKKLTHLIVSSFILILPISGAEKVKPHSAKPRDGFVPTEQTAIQIAIAVWIPIYGKENIEKQKPYKAWLKDGVWHVAGHLSKNMVGGVAIAEIQKSDAKILRISHGR